MSVTLRHGHCVEVLRGMAAESVDLCVTSPPYHGLRSYGTEPQVWDEPAERCEHEWADRFTPNQNAGGGVTFKQATNVGSFCSEQVRADGGPLPRKVDGPRGHTTAFCALCGAWRGELGLEPAADLYLSHLLQVFREVRRVLHDTGTLWVNLGDSYHGSSPIRDRATWGAPSLTTGSLRRSDVADGYLTAGSLCQIPARFALAMQADGWLLRSAIVLAKGSPMPESVAGWRYERCRVKVSSGGRAGPSVYTGNATVTPQSPPRGPGSNYDAPPLTEWADCPGCPKCEKSDGLVLRRGSWRPTSAYEYLFLFAKGPGYFADGEGARLPFADERRGNPGDYAGGYANGSGRADLGRPGQGAATMLQAGANARNVLKWEPQPLSDAHYAAFPPFIPEFAIKAGTSAHGVCAKCRAPWARVVRRVTTPRPTSGPTRGGRSHSYVDNGLHGSGGSLDDPTLTATDTLGWRATCSCQAERVPAVVLDCFGGSGTSAMVADRLGRDAISIDLQPSYVEIARKRVTKDAGLFAQVEVTR